MAATRGKNVNFLPADGSAHRVAIVAHVNANGSVNLMTINSGGTVGSVQNVLWSDTVVAAPPNDETSIACPLA